MKHRKKIILKRALSLICVMCAFSASGQIGYQVSLLNNSTGEPRANESVNVTVKITDSKGNTICEQTKREITNDFGVLSMSVGDGKTFQNVNWGNLPFFIEATVDSRLIGKSQILSVPVAEHANHTGVLTKELLCSKTWQYMELTDTMDLQYTISFYNDNTFLYKKVEIFLHPEFPSKNEYIRKGEIEIEGNRVLLYYHNDEDFPRIFELQYSPMRNILYNVDEHRVLK